MDLCQIKKSNKIHIFRMLEQQVLAYYCLELKANADLIITIKSASKDDINSFPLLWRYYQMSSFEALSVILYLCS
jgi:hypothetical protein